MRRKNLPMHRWPCIEWDDAFSVGYEALCHAARDWNTEVGPFEPFAFHRVMFRIIDWVRKAGPRTRLGEYKASANTIQWVDHTDSNVYTDIGVPTEHLLRDDQLIQDHADTLMGREFLLYCLRLLPEKQRYVMYQMLVHGRSAPDVARDLGISEDGVWSLRIKAIQRLRRDDEIRYTLG